mgnify:CR=1 FL=1
MNNIQSNDRRFGYFFVAPAVIILSLVILAPIVIAIITSFYDYTLINRSLDNFIGLNNYFESITNKKFLHSTFVTITFIFFVVLFEFLIGFLIAILLNQVERFRNIYYFILLIPLLINPVVVGLIWMIFHVGLLVIVAKIIRAPFFFLAVGSKANVGGAASAPIVASAFHPSLAPVGVLLAVLGYALGTYGAILCATLMEIASP